MVQLPPWIPSPAQVAIPVAVLLSLALVRRLDAPAGQWGRRLRSRFLLGVPWGTLVSVLGVLAVYLFVQGGAGNWRNPVTLPFSSWSYLYPTGWLLAPFSHTGPGHLVGNLTTTLAVAPLAEYFFGHFPSKRGENPFFSRTSNPWIRAFVVFPAGVALVGVATSVFAWGPIIGFSGVAFAFVGFALVRYPLMTVVAVTAQGAIRTAYRAVRDPIVVGSASRRFGDPWWFGIAVQGHALGLLLGILLGVVVLYRRRERVGALRLWTGAVLLGMSMTLWALWWYRGESTYVLYRGWGVVFVVALAVVTTVAATADRRPLFGDVSRQQVGLLALLLPLAIMVGVAVPVNLTTVGDASVPGGGPAIEVRGYDVTYAEGVQNQKVSAIDVSMFGETTNVTTSGVIVVNDDREIWAQSVSKGRLAFTGRASVRVGGVGWSEDVQVKRRGWSMDGGGTAYQVWLRGPDDGEWTHTFASGPATAGATLANRSIRIAPANGTFYLRLLNDNATSRLAQIPAHNETVRLGPVRIEREHRKLFAAVNGTRVQIATREKYR
ncbi:rhomboid-like intramembrane serine protease [Halorussus gelatinilyticus]|uniref:Rhomboid-like intramembrane serine protease n=1 Tax=Halorussus gelatinilyticus TaxID=2937524 RepID=A0A8U0IHT0_9EURY|nr:rhomboid-like intramembrane serine protease [Halorussus gelatinilyticus]UPV99821.1 rhomboid-like intramembrane serine protease [Halorussus gelatinilyticus]